MNTDKISIAIIDDGINVDCFNIGQLQYDKVITSDLKISQRINYNTYSGSHGTTCSAIIKKNSPKAIISSIKILNDHTYKATKTQLIEAIKWCIYNNIKLINISLGSKEYCDFKDLRDIINIAYKNGLIIIAACNNKNIYTVPASLSNVIGVSCDKLNKLKEHEYVFYPNSLNGIEIVACGKHSLINYKNITNITHPCNSFAAPVITSLVYNIIQKNPKITFEKIKFILYSQSKKNSEFFDSNRFLDWVEKALVFIFGEKDDMVTDLTSCYNIIDVILSKNNEADSIVKFIFDYFADKNILYNFDTIVLILKDINKFTRKHHLQLISKFSFFNINLVILPDKSNDNIQNLIKVKNIKYWDPSILHTYVKNYFNYCHEYDENLVYPLVIFYNIANDNMVDLLYELKRNFYENNYNITVITDQSLGALYDLEYFPINHIINCYKEKSLTLLNNICKIHETDLLLINISVNDFDDNAITRSISYFQPDIFFYVNKNCNENEIENSGGFYLNINKDKTYDLYTTKYKKSIDFAELMSFIIEKFESNHKSTQ